MDTVQGNSIEDYAAEGVEATTPGSSGALAVLIGHLRTRTVDNAKQHTISAVKNGLSPQNTVVFVGALIPKARVPVAITTFKKPARNSLIRMLSDWLSGLSEYVPLN